VYRGISDAFFSTLRNEGPRGLYRGIVPSLVGIFPFCAVDFATFDLLKTSYRRRTGDDAPTPVLLACGAVSGTAGQFVAYPLDLVRRRLQIQGMSTGQTVAGSPTPSSGPRPGAVDILRTQYAEQGIRGWYRGMGANMLKVVPAVSISWAVYEHTKRALGVG
jgi:solute carrier family 25 (mitochondrial phosphate transporter), member 23/24/25/41